MSITKHISDIKKNNEMIYQYKYDASHWSSLDSNYRSLIKEYDDKFILRKMIFESYSSYFKTGKDYLKPFILTMVWGFGKTGYGAFRTQKYLSGVQNKKQIDKSLKAIKDNNLQLAFESLMLIKGLGVSFISKVLYFGSKAAIKNNYALIFDIRVAKALVQLYTPTTISNIVKVTPSNNWADYWGYCQLLHGWAAEHKLEADKIELYLFSKGGK